MAKRYIPVGLDELTELLKPEKGWVATVAGGEVVFDYVLKSRPDAVIRVYSSCQRGASTARDVGRDAIRVVAFNPKTQRGLLKLPRVYRTKSWRDAIRQRVTHALGILAVPRPTNTVSVRSMVETNRNAMQEVNSYAAARQGW